jgi:para-aminobenzoate synthetase component 1
MHFKSICLSSCFSQPTVSGYFDLADMGSSDAQIVSASPERFFAVRDGVVETRPIKGTRRRTGTPMVDIHNRKQLTASEKDRSENTMIVDLMRNDLSKCCVDESIEVTQLCELEEYQSVLHLVSAVQGRLNPGTDLVDLIESIFPGGSITGAPKIRAMEIIAELEPNSRGAYCGALGYLGFDGAADFSILIRTITASGGRWQIPVGGGVVSQSDPEREYEETWTKAAGMLRAVTE